MSLPLSSTPSALRILRQMVQRSKQMSQSPPPGVQHLTARIAYENPTAALEFLQRAFGFPERTTARLEGKGGLIIVAEVQIGDSYLMIGPAGAHAIASPKSTGLSTESLMVYVDDIDEHFRNAKAQGALIVEEPSDQYWGDRRYETRDLEGHLWFFHQRTKEVSRHEIEKIEATFRNG
jgi:uncharacterized glyoxalase superfamily protein PhnB